jgi:glycosyltransferase involved in cell wall biosynthesis
MRIAHVSATFPPYWAGTGNVAYHNARILSERGHDVVVFTAQTPRDAELSFPFSVERLAAPLRLGNAPLTPALISRLRRFDLIHLHYPYIFGAELTAFASKRFRIPLVLTYHNQLQERHALKRFLFSTYNTLLEPLILARAQKLFAVRKEHLESLHSKLCSSTKVRELCNGVDSTLFRPQDKSAARQVLELPLGAPVILFVGALDQAHRFKNVEGLLRAFNYLREDARLLIVGDGDLREVLEERAATLGVRARVHFLGLRPPSALPTIYSAADVTVLPSVRQESFGLPLIESMACGTPVIASNLPGLKEAVCDGEDGYLVAPGEIDDLTSALQRALGDRQHLRCMGHRALSKIRAEYEWDTVGDRLEGLYREVLST